MISYNSSYFHIRARKGNNKELLSRKENNKELLSRKENNKELLSYLYWIKSNLISANALKNQLQMESTGHC